MTKSKVLVIDDERLLTKSTCMALNHYGFDTCGTLDGEQGILAAGTFSPDIILLDIMMPGMDGWQVLQKLKEQDSTRHIPVIIFTAKEHSDGVALARAHGADNYIAKPFEMDDMVAILNRHIAKKSPDANVSQGDL